jgi:hypothetical protein
MNKTMLRDMKHAYRLTLALEKEVTKLCRQIRASAKPGALPKAG